MQKTIKFNKLNIFLHCLALIRGQAAERTYIAEYTYDENGIKTSVKAEGKTTYFIYEGNTLLGQYTDNDGTIENAMLFLYDENGEIQGVQHNGRMYYYQKDIMGNVYTIRNASGGSSGAYKYEAYGHNFFGYDGNDPFRNINPIKYRGYYYDSYYGGYYNLSRYYNPGMGRFLNLDDPMIALQSKSDPDGMNLYTYCNNDPVNYVDPTGYSKLSNLVDKSSNLASLVSGIASAIVTLAIFVAKKATFWNYVSKIATCIATIATGCSFISAMKKVKSQYNKNSRRYKTLKNYNVILLSINIIVLIVGEILGGKVLRSNREIATKLILATIGVRIITVFGVAINLVNIIAKSSLASYRTK